MTIFKLLKASIVKSFLIDRKFLFGSWRLGQPSTQVSNRQLRALRNRDNLRPFLREKQDGRHHRRTKEESHCALHSENDNWCYHRPHCIYFNKDK